MADDQSNAPDPQSTETSPDGLGPAGQARSEPAKAGVLPEKVGQFHITRCLASGGMGTVYEAMQEHPRRRVALKVMKQGIASRSAMRRFEYESQILARLRHPGIAQVYEAGTHDDGTGAVPYFAMEYVPNAKPITKYASDRRLSVRERLEFFVRVCDACHHGHQKAIIHRDLKPDNILVDSAGEVKIIDFGVARGTDSDMAITTLQTDVGQLVGTLRYMSPEQCEADPHDIDTRSDVYTLGVVLYELLCGKLPYDISAKPIHESLRLIREQQPAPLSTANTSLKGDVETIVFKAIEKDRDRRYQSALELAKDIHRYLAGEAIMARAPSILYQLRVFARRNRVWVGAAAVVLVVLVAGIVISTIFAIGQGRARRDAERQRAEAERQARIAWAVYEFLTEDVLAAIAPAKQGLKTAREVLDEASKNVEDKFTDEPLIEASIRFTLANTYWDLGEYEPAVQHAEKALRLRRAELGEVHPATLDSMNTLAVLYKYQGRYDEAEPLHVKALETRRRVLGNEHPDTLESMNNLAVLLRCQGKLDEAESLHRQTLAIRRRTLGPENPDTLSSMANLAVLLWDKGKLDEAEALARQACETRRRVLPKDHPDTLHSVYSLAAILARQDKLDEAERLYRRSLEAARRFYGDEHARVATILNDLAQLLQGKGDYDAAETMLREALAMRRTLLGEHDWRTGNTKSNLGECLTRAGRYDEAERELLAAHHTLEAILGGSHWRTNRTVERLGTLYDAWGKPELAAAWRARATPSGSPAHEPSLDR